MTRPLRIAVADDERDVREYLERLLPRLGHTVVAAAETGLELVAACERHRPDLVITDVRMPGLDGDAAVREIWRTAPVPVILVSAYQRPAGLGGDGSPRCSYLNKPVRRDALEAAIRAVEGDLTPDPTVPER